MRSVPGIFRRRFGGVVASLLGARCTVCGALLGAGHARDCLLCDTCLREFAFRTGGYCPRCGELFEDSSGPVYLCGACRRHVPPWSGIGFYGAYRGLLRETIHEFKFSGRLDRSRVLQELLARAFFGHGLGFPDMIVPVPLHPARLRMRGFNQSLELSRFLGRVLEVPVSAEALLRERNTVAQSTLSRSERLANLKNAFSVRRDVCRGRSILLVDDVMTTGTTLRTCVVGLRRAGAVRVDVLVLARA